MKPSKDLADSISDLHNQKTQLRIKELGTSGLKAKEEALQAAERENKQPLPDKLRKSFPPIPSTASISKIPIVTKVSVTVTFRAFDLVQMISSSLGFPIHFMQSPTKFCHCRVCFHLEGLPSELQPYLVLFQELIVETDLMIPKGSNKMKRVPFADVVRQLSQEVRNWRA